MVLDPIPQYVVPATVSFVAADAQFTPKTVETKDERDEADVPRQAQDRSAGPAEHLQAGEDRRARHGLRAHRRGDGLAAEDLQVKLPAAQNDRGFVARVAGVSHRYGASIALDDVTIDIPARIMVGVIGPDGVGKSTLLALISGVRKIQQGKVVGLRRRRGRRRASQGHSRPHRLYAAGPGPQSLSDAERVREYRFLRPAVRARRRGAPGAHHRTLDRDGPRARSRTAPPASFPAA